LHCRHTSRRARDSAARDARPHLGDILLVATIGGLATTSIFRQPIQFGFLALILLALLSVVAALRCFCDRFAIRRKVLEMCQVIELTAWHDRRRP